MRGQHNSASVVQHNRPAQRFATGFGVDNTVIAGMATGITRPASVEHKLEDIARGRTVDAWRHIPEIAEACVQDGGSFYYIGQPLTRFLAHIKRRCTGKLPGDMKSALLSVKKESDEAEAMALTLAFCGELPSASALVTFEKEACEAELALAKAREIVADLLAAREQK